MTYCASWHQCTYPMLVVLGTTAAAARKPIAMLVSSSPCSLHAMHQGMDKDPLRIQPTNLVHIKRLNQKISHRVDKMVK